MKKLKAFCKSFHKNVIVRRKYRAFWMLLTDHKFRADLNRLHELCKNTTQTEFKQISVENIVYGHAIIYPGYVLSLLTESFDPLKLVWDKSINKYVVVDGNHRLAVILLRKQQTTYCEVIS